jgi:hypothetical protein
MKKRAKKCGFGAEFRRFCGEKWRNVTDFGESSSPFICRQFLASYTF